MLRITHIEALARITERMPNYAPCKGGQAESLTFLAVHGEAYETLYEYKQGKLRIFAPAFDELPPIIGTCEVGEEDMPEVVEDWLTDYARELEQLENGTAALIDGEKGTQEDGETINPLIATKWAQKDPYNRYIINGCVTGCGATAVAMLIKYWGDLGFHRGMPPTESYTTKTSKYIVPALKSVLSFDYKNMPTGKPRTSQEIAAVATLMQHVGYALKSDYKTTGTSSGLTNIAKVLKDNLQMGSKVKAIYASNGAKVFEESIKEEIKAARPVFLGGWNSSGTGGHFFLVDGYDPITNFFHINWGAGGSYDGWFALTALNPGKYNYSSYKKAVIGVQPDYAKGDVNGDGRVSVSDVMMVQQMILKHQYSEAADVNQDGVVDVVDMMAIVQEIMKGNTL